MQQPAEEGAEAAYHLVLAERPAAEEVLLEQHLEAVVVVERHPSRRSQAVGVVG